MSRPNRIFIALPIPAARAEKLARLQSLIAPSLPGARWVTPQMFHLTLAFLGNVPDIELNPLCRAVTAAVRNLPSLTLSIWGLGVFPDAERPRVAWAGLKGDDLESLSALREVVVKAVSSVGYAPEDQRFSPHITLGHIKVGRETAGDHTPLLRHYERWPGGPLAIEEVVTYASQLTPEGPAYVALGRAPLKRR